MSTKTDTKQTGSTGATSMTNTSRGKSIRNVNSSNANSSLSAEGGGSTVVPVHEQAYDEIVGVPSLQQQQQQQQQQQADVIMEKRMRIAHKQPPNIQSQVGPMHQAQQIEQSTQLHAVTPQPTASSIQAQQKPTMSIEYTDLANFNTLATVAAAQSPNMSVNSPRHGKVNIFSIRPSTITQTTQFYI
jgi:hypothetical protein